MLTPRYDASRTTPVMWLCPAGGSARSSCRRIFSGRTPTLTFVASPTSARGARTRVSSARRTAEYVPSFPSTAPGSRLLTPRKPATNRVVGRSYRTSGLAQLLVAALVHDGDAIGHRHRLFLVVGHVDERDPDLLLDPLELHLHLLAQLEVERAERLVEQQYGRLVDQRSGERDALRLATRDLRRLARLVPGQLDQA